MNEINENIVYPSIIFKLAGTLYCANSKHIATIMKMPKVEHMPDKPAFVKGIFPYWGEIYQLADLRTFFGKPDLEDECEQFSGVMETYQQVLAGWISELEAAAETGEPFALEQLDPHQCDFGRWYDSFSVDNSQASFHLSNIDEPHKQLHALAKQLLDPNSGVNTSLLWEQIRNNLEPKITGMLEEAKKVYANKLGNKMVLLFSDCRMGIIVDEVLAVDDITEVGVVSGVVQGHDSITGVVKSAKIPGEILALDIPTLMQYMGMTPNEEEI